MLNDERVYLKYNEDSVDVFLTYKEHNEGYLYSTSKTVRNKIQTFKIIKMNTKHTDLVEKDVAAYDLVMKELKEVCAGILN